MNSRPSEFDLIRKYFAPLCAEGSFKLSDDAALLSKSKGHSFVITQDALAEGVHFFSDDEPDCIAKKAIRVNLSDLAAKGARPKYISVALGLGNNWSEAWVRNFAQGIAQDCQKYSIELTGGDTFTTGGGCMISITAIGEVPYNSYVSRLGAKRGNLVFVTGTIGDAALGLLVRQGKLDELSKPHSEFLKERYLLPQPATGFIKSIQNHATASMDISDGLLGDAEKLCRASGTGADLNLGAIPLSAAAKAAIELESNLLETALSGGDDYEILFTVDEGSLDVLQRDALKDGVEITQIGRIASGQALKVFDTLGHVVNFKNKSYDHSGENH